MEGVQWGRSDGSEGRQHVSLAWKKSFENCDYHFLLIMFDFERDPDWFIPKLYLATCSHDIARPEQMHI